MRSTTASASRRGGVVRAVESVDEAKTVVAEHRSGAPVMREIPTQSAANALEAITGVRFMRFARHFARSGRVIQTFPGLS